MHATKSLQHVDARPVHPIADTKGTNWLLIGSDSRAGLSEAEQKELHTGGNTGSQRADVIIIVHLGEHGGPTLVSLPRDSYVTIPAHKALDGSSVSSYRNKINASYSYGGAPLLTATVEKNTGLHIDHYLQVGFAGIRDLTQAVSGVEICVPRNYDDKNSGLHVKKGCQVMNGDTALAYVRMRYADPTGDIGRIQRQQQFLAAVTHKVSTPATLANPMKLWKISDAATAAVVAGKGDSARDVLNLARSMRALSQGTGSVQTVPISNPNATTSVGSSVLWDWAKARALFATLGAN